MLIRSTLSAIAAAGLALALVPLGCGAAQEEYPRPAHPQEETSSAADVWAMPEAIVEQLRGCVKQHAADLKTYSHETKFEVTVTEEGAVKGVKVRNSTLHHEGIESCMTGALAGLSIPPSMFPVRSSSEPFSGGESSRHSRGPLGITQALAGAVALGPIIIVAAGVTLGVYILAVTAEEALAVTKRRRKIDLACDPPFYVCLANMNQPDWNIWRFGTQKDCLSCIWECRKDEGVWPNYKCPPPGYRPN